MENINRKSLADLIYAKLLAEEKTVKKQFSDSKDKIGYFFIDDSPVKVDRIRCCVSNYYCSDQPLQVTDEFQVTSFRGRPEQKAVDVILRVDNTVRMGLRKIFNKGITEKPHVYKKNKKYYCN